jgi:hypothetical protein
MAPSGYFTTTMRQQMAKPTIIPTAFQYQQASFFNILIRKAEHPDAESNYIIYGQNPPECAVNKGHKVGIPKTTFGRIFIGVHINSSVS